MLSLAVFGRKKRAQTPLSMLALYDAPSAQIACDAGIDAILVGDSLGNTVLGFDSTIPVTLDDIARHLGAVVRGVKSSSRPNVAIIADMPFATYATPEKAVANAAHLMQLGAHAVKIEGVLNGAIFQSLADAGIPVMGHLGFTPQSVLRFENVVQAKTALDAALLEREAQILASRGCFALVLEAVTIEVAQKISENLQIPTIGIGAGVGCDGQVLVWHDLVGLTEKPPKFAKKWADTREVWGQAVREYVNEVGAQTFPAEAHGWHINEEEEELWKARFEDK